MGKTVAIVQSNYIPWRGYFDLIGLSDEFIILDTVQFTKNDWRNRNLIKTARGTDWLTIPVVTAGRLTQTIDETCIADKRWARRHMGQITAAYSTAPHFEDTAHWLFPHIANLADEPRLTVINEHLLSVVSMHLGLATRIRRSSDIFDAAEMSIMEPTTRLVAMCQASGAGSYLSGPAAKSYLDEGAFAAAGISVRWMSYEGYAEYPQLWGTFEPRVSIIDLMFNSGPDACRYLKCGGP